MTTETITINPPNARPGDTYVIRFPYGETELSTGVTMRDEPVSLTIYGPYTVSVEREIPAVPTKNGAVLYPTYPEDAGMVVKDEDGRWRVAFSGTVVSDEYVRERLHEGAHYVAFEGVE